MDIFLILQALQPKINSINDLIDSYFNRNPNEKSVTPKQLSDFSNKYPPSISAQTIRKLLRRLDELRELKRVPRVNPIRKRINTSWKFEKERSFQGIQ